MNDGGATTCSVLHREQTSAGQDDKAPQRRWVAYLVPRERWEGAFRMFQQQKLPAGAEDASHLTQCGYRGFEDAQAEGAEDRVKLPIWKRKGGHVPYKHIVFRPRCCGLATEPYTILSCFRLRFMFNIASIASLIC